MADEIDDIINTVLKNEGGFQQWKSDTGNYLNGQLIGTNKGITAGRLAEWRGVKHVTANDMRTLSTDEARAIYRDRYYDKPGFEQLPPFMRRVVMDFYVTSGTWATKGLQRVLGEFGLKVGVDGKVGSQTAKACYDLAQIVPEDIIIAAYCYERARFYRAIVASRPSQAVFLKGWLTRANSFWPKTVRTA